MALIATMRLEPDLQRAPISGWKYCPASGIRHQLGSAARRIAAKAWGDQSRPCHLFEMAGDLVGARDSYLEAARRTTNLPQQRYLRARAARLT